jgi:uncharacterized protein (DUF2461 family)
VGEGRLSKKGVAPFSNHHQKLTDVLRDRHFAVAQALEQARLAAPVGADEAVAAERKGGSGG